MLTFGKISEKQGDVEYTLDIAPDRRAVTFATSGLELLDQGGKSPSTSSPRVASLVLPLEGDDERAEIEFIAQGSYVTWEGTTATMVCTVNGQTTVVDVPDAREDSFVQKLSFAAKKPSECRLTILLVLGSDSKNAGAGGHLTVTSIDVEILPRSQD